MIRVILLAYAGLTVAGIALTYKPYPFADDFLAMGFYAHAGDWHAWLAPLSEHRPLIQKLLVWIDLASGANRLLELAIALAFGVGFVARLAWLANDRTKTAIITLLMLSWIQIPNFAVPFSSAYWFPLIFLVLMAVTSIGWQSVVYAVLAVAALGPDSHQPTFSFETVPFVLCYLGNVAFYVIATPLTMLTGQIHNLNDYTVIYTISLVAAGIAGLFWILAAIACSRSPFGWYQAFVFAMACITALARFDQYGIKGAVAARYTTIGLSSLAVLTVSANLTTNQRRKLFFILAILLFSRQLTALRALF